MPQFLLDLRFRWHLFRTRRRYRSRSIADTFSEVYRRGLWGEDGDAPFHSGAGSAPAYTLQYAALIRQFIGDRGIRSVVDLGCGDFRVGRLLVDGGSLDYTGVDVVPDLIRHHQERFASPNVRFACLDITRDDPPAGELCLVRQVLQHLSNEEIARALEHCRQYKYVIVTEHLYLGPGARHNLDKPHGPDVRVSDRSGVFLDQPPFGLNATTLLDVPFSATETIRSVLVEIAAPAPHR